MDPLYLTPPPEVIIILLLIVSESKYFSLSCKIISILTNGVGHKSSSDGHTPTKEEGESDIGRVSKKKGLQGIKETEVHATVDEDTDSRDGKASVQTLDTVRLEGLGVDVNETIELSLTSLALGVIGQPVLNKNE